MGHRALVASLAVGALLTGCAPIASSAVPSTAPPTVPASATPPPPVPVVDAAPTPSAAAVVPVRVVVEGRDIDMPVVPVGVEAGGFMKLPADPAVAGWYRYGPGPWDPDGSVVLAAHIDAPDYPIGPLAGLQDVGAGTVIAVTAEDGTEARYAVESVTFYPKADLPIDQLFARDGARTLVLITCGGDFDETTGHYDDNVVAVASALP